MTDSVLANADQKEVLSYLYVQAIAARAGYTTATRSLDRDGVDLQIQARGDMRPALDLQLKATVKIKRRHGGSISCRLKIRNYNLLRLKTQTPRLLVVLDLPEDEDRWMTVTAHRLIMRRCAYWLSLRGHGEKPNKNSITVRIPEENIFNVGGLKDLMMQSRRGVVR